MKNKYVISKTINCKFKKVKNKHSNLKKIVVFCSLFIFVSIIFVSISNEYFPVYKISTNSMEPTINEDDIILTTKSTKIKNQDIILFKNNEKILIRRVIGTSGDVINIKEDGTVYVNSLKIKETYVKKRQLGNSDLVYPYVVPENQIFVLNDDRSEIHDSRIKSFGCISINDVIGTIRFSF